MTNHFLRRLGPIFGDGMCLANHLYLDALRQIAKIGLEPECDDRTAFVGVVRVRGVQQA